MLNLVKIRPISDAAHEAVAKHGDVMELDIIGQHKGRSAIRVRSLKEEWGDAGRKNNWSAWFDVTEATWEIYDGTND